MKKLFFVIAAFGCAVACFPIQAANIYQTTVSGQSPAHWFKLDGSFADSVISSLVLTTNNPKLSFTNDIFGNTNAAADFNQSSEVLLCPSNIINGAGSGPDAGDVATNTGSISFLFYMINTNNTGQRFVFSQGITSANDNQLSLFLENTTVGNGDPNSLKLRVGTTTATIITNQFLTPGAWYYFAMTYDESRDSDEVHWYVGPVGKTLFTGTNDITNTAIVGDSTVLLTIGNKSGPIGGTSYSGAWYNTSAEGGSNGVIDEFAVWNRELSTSEINAQFSAANGTVALPSPRLNITVNGTKALLSWTTNNTSGFALESTSTLLTNSWSTAGAETNVVGTNYVVTNSLSITNKNFYRLHHP